MLTTVASSNLKGLSHHLYEDRYRLLGCGVPLVERAGRGQLFAVMDGIGSAPRGAEAAQRVADRLVDFFSGPDCPGGARLTSLLQQVNDDVFAWGFIPGTDRPLGGAAVTAAWLSPARELVIAHVGDTRAYRFDGTRLTRLTTDHTDGRAIMRYLGQGDRFTVDLSRSALEEGDLLCLVTDGVIKGLRDDDIQRVLAEVADVDRCARTLVERARSRGSRDDITAVLIELEEW